MNSKNGTRPFAPMIAFCVLASCGAPADDAQSSAPWLQGEITPSGVQYIYRYYYTQADIAAASYAHGLITVNGSSSCQVQNVGPNLLLSAGHCGASTSIVPTYYTIRNGGAPDGTNTVVMDSESWSQCSYIEQSFPGSDLMFIYCPNNAAGIGPGDKYGYLDYDFSHPTVGASEYEIMDEQGSLAATMVAPATNWGMPTYLLGSISSTTLTHAQAWEVPAAAGGIGIGSGFSSCQNGSSGGAILNPSNHRLWIAGRTNCDNSMSMNDYDYWGQVTPNIGGTDGVNHTLVSSLGLTPSTYYGYLAKTLDSQFDLQQDLERLRGENSRDWYNLGFQSLRRDNVWTSTGNGTVSFITDPSTRQMQVHSTTAGDLALDNLNLTAGTYSYRITFPYWTNSVGGSTGHSTSSNIYVGIKGGNGQYYGAYIPTDPTAGVTTRTILAAVPSAAVSGSRLVVWGFGVDTDVFFASMSVVREGAIMDFDTYDKRDNWRDDNTGGRAVIVPDGQTTGTPNWAARVIYNSGFSYGGWPVRNRQLALHGGTSYSICFYHKQDGASSVGGWFELASGGTSVVSGAFTAGSSWSQRCFTSPTLPSDDNTLHFQFLNNSPGTPYLIDNVSITPN